MTTLDKTADCAIILKNKAFERLLRWCHSDAGVRRSQVQILSPRLLQKPGNQAIFRLFWL